MELLRFWLKHGIGTMDFLLTGGKPSFFDAEAASLGARLHYLCYGRAHLDKFLPAYRSLLSQGKYDVVHDHCDYASGWHFLLGLGVLPPIRIAHVHNSWVHIETNYAVTPSRRVVTAMGKRLVNMLATRISGTSAATLREYGFEPNRRHGPPVNVVHCGFDVSLFCGPREPERASVLHEFGWSPDAKIILFVGRLDRAPEFDHFQNSKNSWLALNIARAALLRDPCIRLLMAGAGDEQRRELERHVLDWGLRDKMRLIGVRRDIPRLMRAANALLMPSRQEGLGMVAVEAQAAGLPVLASNGVPREAIVIPDLYVSMALAESVESWAEALIGTAAKPRPPSEFCRAALERSDYSIVNSVRNLTKLYTARS